MGTTDVSDIAHSSQTDHRILKTISTSTSATAAAGQEWTFFDNADERLPAWERDRSGGVALYVQYTKNQDPQQLKEAKKKLLAAEAVVGNDPITLSYLGATFLAENDLNSAEKCFAATLKLTPFNEETLQQMAHVQFMKNNLSTANEYFEKLTQLDPWASARFGPYAFSLVKAGDINGAIDALKHSLSNDPTQYRLHLYLATLLESSGRHDEAAVHRRFANSLEQLVRPGQAAGMGMR
jgi:predicted Zn-dependent protease